MAFIPLSLQPLCVSHAISVRSTKGENKQFNKELLKIERSLKLSTARAFISCDPYSLTISCIVSEIELKHTMVQHMSMNFTAWITEQSIHRQHPESAFIDKNCIEIQF